MADTVIDVIKGEKKHLVFTITDEDGNAVDCSGTTKALTGGNTDNSSLYSVADGSFVTDEANVGILKAMVDFTTEGVFSFVISIEFASGVIEKEKFTVDVEDDGA